MRRLIIIGVLVFCGFISLAQGIGSVFTQQDDKDKLMMEQIALQESYLSAIKTGYKDTQTGLNTAHDLKDGSFTANQNYFNSLSQVSSAVKNNPKIQLISTYQQQINSSFQNEIAWQQQQAILGTDEISYMQQVYNNMLTACTLDLDELKTVITSGQVQMKDAERIKHIDAIYTSMGNKYKFSVSFLQRAHAFALDRQSNKQQSAVMGKLYNLN